jgi:hypothetical protein
MSSHPDAGARRTAPAEHQAPVQLYALRLRPAAQPPGDAASDDLRGEVEHVLSGARCAFRDTAELVAWLQERQVSVATGRARPAADQAGQPGGPARRDATM